MKNDYSAGNTVVLVWPGDEISKFIINSGSASVLMEIHLQVGQTSFIIETPIVDYSSESRSDVFDIVYISHSEWIKIRTTPLNDS